MTDYEKIEKVIRYLEANYRDQPSLAKLAKIAGASEFHFHRLFTRWAGTSPKSFLQYLTAKHAQRLLLDSKDLLTTAFDAGLSGPGRLHDLMISVEAVTPGEFKAKGSGVEIKYGIHECPFGLCLIAMTKRGVCHLAFIDAKLGDAVLEMKQRFPMANFKAQKKETGKIVKSIFKKSGANNISLVLHGTPFQMKVWEALLRIPEGKVLSYADLAKVAGAPGASRAVGSALGKNSIAYLIPCHRVIRASGDFGDYRWGLSRKRALLGWESARTEAADS